jgi:hemoglobin
MAGILILRTLATLAVLTVAMASTSVAAAEFTLYQRIGGNTVVARVVSDLIDRAAADRRTRRSFEGTNLARIKGLVAEQICEITDGGCRYSGDSMREVHAGQRISQAEFYAFTELLQDSLRRAGVGIAARNELIARVAPMKRDIVERTTGEDGRP